MKYASPELVNEMQYGIESAFFIGILEIADSDNIERVTLAVNGGLHGIVDRKNRLSRIKKVLRI